MLANIGFGAFSPDAAREWLGEDDGPIPAAGLTLAELFERKGLTRRHIAAPPENATGIGTHL